MAILYLEYGGDLQLTSGGQMMMATGWDEVRQSIERELLTNPNQTLSDGTKVVADYIYDTTFGEGLGSHVDLPFTQAILARVQQKVYRVLKRNPNVVLNGLPTITATQISPNIVNLLIAVPLQNGATGSINFSVSA